MESLGNLAGGVAHDFNNILAIIANYTDFAIEETGDRPTVQADLTQVRMSGRRLAEILQERRPGLPVLCMSGYSNGLLGSTHVLTGDSAFIEKPFTTSDLLHKLAAVQQASESQLRR